MREEEITGVQCSLQTRLGNLELERHTERVCISSRLL